jgi:hypothetical protein
MDGVSDSDETEDVDWFFARERGQSGPSLSAARVSRYAQLEELMADLPETPVAPPEGWEQRMLAALEAAAAEPGATHATTAASLTSEPPRPSHRRWLIPAVVAAAAAALAIVFMLPEPASPEGPQIAVVVKPAGSNLGAQPGVGDTLVVHATIHGEGELRIYDEAGGEQARCNAASSDCRIERVGGQITLVLSFPVRGPGALRAVLFSPALGTPPSGMDADVAAAVRANVTVTTHEPVRFR